MHYARYDMMLDAQYDMSITDHALLYYFEYQYHILPISQSDTASILTN